MNDYIKREDAIKSLGDAHFKNYGDACIVISNLPSADVVEREEAAKAVDKAFDDGYCKAERTERKRGEWIYHEEWQRDGECAYECSLCGVAYDYTMKFCGNCGADMRQPKERSE